MANEQDRLIHFDVEGIKGLSVTQGYHIANAFPVHFHTTYNLGIIGQGEREFTYRGEKTVVKQDDIFMIQPFEPHSCRSVHNVPHSYKIISLPLESAFYFPHLVIHQLGLLDQIKTFHALAEYEKSSTSIAKVFTEILRSLKACSSACDQESMDPDVSSKIDVAKAFIEHHCHLEISLKEMADVVCLSEFHFNRLFHKQFGLSPYAYYLVCKLKVSQLVLMKQKSVTGTALDTGFFDQSHFTRLFKKHVGVTPGKYLRDNRTFNQARDI